MPWSPSCVACDQPLWPRPGSEGRWARCPACNYRQQVSSNPRAAEPVVPLDTTPPPGPPSRFRVRALLAWAGVFLVLVGGGLTGWALWPPSLGGPGPGSSLGPLPARPGMGPGMPTPILPTPLKVGLRGVILTSPDVEMTVVPDRPAVLEPVAKLPPFLAAVGAPVAGLLLTASDTGELLVHETATFSLRGRFRLPSPAFQLALDEGRGRLYAVAAHRGQVRMTRLGDREAPFGDLHVYDVRAILAGKDGPKELQPLDRLELNAYVSSLLLTRDGRTLFYLAETLRSARVGRLDAVGWKATASRVIAASGVGGMALTPAEDRLYVVASAQLFALSPADCEEQVSVNLGASLHSPVVTDGGLVLMVDRRGGTQVLVVDVDRGRTVARWTLPLDGRPTLQRSPSGQRVYVGSSAVLDGEVWVLDPTGGPERGPRVVRRAASGPDRLLRGPLSVSSDGKLLLLGNGMVLRPEA